MGLGDRRGRERFRIEADERLGSEVLQDDRLDLGEGNGRHLVHEAAQLGDVDVREEVRP
jgi:hypothetical protein